MTAWVTRYLLFAYGNIDAGIWMLYTGILSTAFADDFFFVTGQIYVDQRAPVEMRGAAQGFIAFVTLAPACSWARGFRVWWFRSTPSPPAALERTLGRRFGWCPPWYAAAVLALFALFFRPKEAKA